VLSVLVRPDQRAAARDVVLARTSTIGIREQAVGRYALPRTMVDIQLPGGPVAVKIAHRDGLVLQVTPEFGDVATYAAEHRRVESEVMAEALAAAAALGYRAGARLPNRES
jgi:hypothetical protein